MSESNWNEESIKKLLELRESKDLSWGDIADKLEEEFGFFITSNAARKAYKRYTGSQQILKNVKTTFSAKESNKLLREENKVIVSNQLGMDAFLRKFKKIVNEIEFNVHKPVVTKSKSATERTIVAHISDTHIGINIDPQEMGGVNEYNSTISARRFAKFFKEIANFKLQYRKNTDLVLVLNGDIFAGVIHSQEKGVDLMTTQFAQGLSIFSQGISFLSGYFKSIKIYCVVGNHDRYIHKDNKGRQTEQKWDSFGTNLYIALREIFKKSKNIQFYIPETPYASFKVYNHRFIASHGDTFINLGNPGKSINTGDITKQINAISTGLDMKIDVFMGGHVHKATHQVLDNGTHLIINGTLSGTDPFAQSIGIVGNHPFQQIFEVTKDFPVGDVRYIRLDYADENEKLEKIVKPLDGKY
jgi:predicted MPP superfamily phosphohydrolase